jgi:SPP1 gp7 family putative phage head morphogenesis protein
MPSSVSALEAAARRFQRELLRLEREDAGRIMTEYRRAFGRMQKALAQARAALANIPDGIDPEAWIREERRIRALIAAAEGEMNSFAAYAARVVRERQAQLISQAQIHAEELAKLPLPVAANTGGLQKLGEPSILPAFKTIPVEALSHLVGSLGDGTPLREWAEQFGKKSARRIGEILIDGITNGQGAERIARRLAKHLAGDAARALTVSRTETLRAYRGAKNEWMRSQPKVIKGWQWYARLDRTTCASCWSMHGSFHKPDEVMGSHPNCRCLQIPQTKSFEELGITGIDEPDRTLPNGAEVFAKQSADVQRTVLGSRGYEAYRTGRVQLKDFVSTRRSRAWGVTRTAKTPAAAVAQARNRPPSVKTQSRGVRSKLTSDGQKHRAASNFREAVDIVRRVHNPDAEFIFVGTPHQRGLRGSFAANYRKGDLVGEIGVGKSNRSTLIAIHEMGHALDLQLFGRVVGNGHSVSGTDSLHGKLWAQFKAGDHPMGEWFAAIIASDIRARVNATRYTWAHKGYLLRPDELWARSYEQWITMRSGDPKLLKLLREKPYYWTDSEFVAISAALDKLFGV